MNKFWMVLGEGNAIVSGGSYLVKDEAISVAKKLAEENNKPFWIFQSVGVATRTDPPVVYIEEGEE